MKRLLSATSFFLIVLLFIASCTSGDLFAKSVIFTKGSFSITLTNLFSEPSDYSEYMKDGEEYDLILTSHNTAMYLNVNSINDFSGIGAIESADHSLDAYADYVCRLNGINGQLIYVNDIPMIEYNYYDDYGDIYMVSLIFFYKHADNYYVCDFIYYPDEAYMRDRIIKYASTVTFNTES